MHSGSTFKTPRDAAGAALGPGRLLPVHMAASGVHGGFGSPGLPCERDIERLSVLEQKAAQGSADAQFEVACMLLDGRGVPRDRDFGVEWLKCVPPLCATVFVNILPCWHHFIGQSGVQRHWHGAIKGVAMIAM